MTGASLEVKTATQSSISDEEPAPSFLSELKPQSVEEGEEVKMECHMVTEAKVTKVEWLKDGTPVSKDAHFIVEQTMDNKLSLKIDKATSKDVGVYSCRVETKRGEATTGASLDVKKAQVAETKDEEPAPSFLSELKPQFVKEGDEVEMECQLITDAKVTKVEWLKDGQPVPDADKHFLVEQTVDNRLSLKIDKAVSQDVGVYSCRVTTKRGEATTGASLEVKVGKQEEIPAEETGPLFAQDLGAQSVEEGKDVELECVLVSGVQATDVTWLKDDQPIEVDGKHIVEEKTDDGHLKLKIKLAKSEDIGKYTCQVATATAKGESKGSLDVKKATESEVPMETAPEFVEGLKPVEAEEGEERIVLLCRVVGSPAPEVQWLKDDTPVATDSPHFVAEQEDDGTARLKIDKAVCEDAGVFKAVAVNKAGKAETQGKLSVQEKHAAVTDVAEERAPEFAKALEAVSAAEGSEVKLECQVAEVGPGLEVHWLKDGQPVAANEHLEVVSMPDGTQSLTIKGAETVDVGKYTCEVVTKAGKAETAGSLEVKTQKAEISEPAGKKETAEEANKAPEFVKVLHSVTVREAQTAVMECRVSGRPKPDIVWFKDGNKLSLGTEFIAEDLEDGTQKLKIVSANSSHVGEYRCEATNSAGKAWTEAPFVLQEAASEFVEAGVAPDFVEPMKSVVTEEGGDVVLQARVAGEPTPEIKWFKDGSPLEGAGESGPDGLLQLKLPAVAAKDGGEYRVEASNALGVVWSDATLQVTKAEEKGYPPEFIKKLEETEVVEGETAELFCIAKGLPCPEIEVRLNGKPVGAGVKVEVKAVAEDRVEVRIRIEGAKEAHAGKYEAIATNKLGKVNTTATLRVRLAQVAAETIVSESAPEFLQPLQPVTADEGAVAVLQARVTGMPQPEVKWFRDGAPIRVGADGVEIEALDDGTHRLKIQKTTAEDQGNYKLEAFNSAGTMSTKAPLTVNVAEEGAADAGAGDEAPAFKKALEAVQAAAGSEAVLECVVANAESVAWFKGDEPITKDTPGVEIKSKPDGTQQLVLKDAKPEDAGLYRIEASNKAGAAKSDAEVKVVDEKPAFAEGLKAASAKEGESVKMTAKAKKTKGTKPVVKWYRNGKELQAGDGVEMSEDADGTLSLKLSDLKASDAGDITVALTNSAGTTESKAALAVEKAEKKEEKKAEEAAVDEKPAFAEGLKAAKAQEGESVTMTAKAEKTKGAKPTVKWYRNGKELQAGSGVEMTEAADGTISLKLADVKAKDAGQIKVTLSNSAGTVDSEAALTIEKKAEKAEADEKPAFAEGLKAAKAQEGESVTMAAKAEKTKGAKPTVKWYRNGKELQAGSGVEMTEAADGTISLKLADVKAEDAGQIKVSLSNSAGTVDSEAALTIEKKAEKVEADEKPAFAEGLKAAKAQEGESVTMAAKAEKTKGAKPTVKWYRNGKELKAGSGVEMTEAADGTISLKLADVKAEDAGQIKVTLSNSAGTADSEAALTIEKKAEEKEEAKTDAAAGSTPKFVDGLASVTVEEGGATTVSCRISGEPFPTLAWFKDGKPLEAANADVDASGVIKLPFPAAALDDGGHYTLKLSNPHGEAESDCDLTVSALIKLQAPEFIKGLDKLDKVKEDSKVVLEVEVNTIDLKITWRFNDEEIISGTKGLTTSQISATKFALTIEKCTFDFLAPNAFSCTARNELGAVLTKGELKKEADEPLEFIKKLGDTVGKKGADLALSVQVTGTPKTVKWYRNGKEIEPDAKNELFESPDGVYGLRIKAANAQDEGFYKVVLENSRGSIQSSTEIKSESSEDKLSLRKGLEDQTLPAGTKLALSVEVIGKPKIVKWYRNGMEVTAKDGARFEEDEAKGVYSCFIPSAATQDTGTYRVTLMNGRGDIESDCAVTIREKLEILEGLQDKTVREGEGCTLEALIKGRPTSIKWYRNGQLLGPEGMRIRTEAADDGSITLKVDESREADAGTYKLVISDGLSPDIETSAVLKVDVPKPKEPEDVSAKFTLPLMDVGEEEGPDVTLKVAFTGKPFPEVAWLKDDVEIEASARFVITTNQDGTSTLCIKKSTPGDSGKYKCIIQNKAGSDKTNCQVFISKKKAPKEEKPPGDPPTFIRKPADKEVEPGDDVKLEARVMGKPIPSVAWFKDGQPITAGVETETRDGEVVSRLIIPASDVTSATYTVKATNPVGEEEAPAKLTLAAPKPPEELAPKFVIPASLQSVKEGENAVFDVKVRGKPAPTVKWYKNGQELRMDSKTDMEDMSDGRWRLTLKECTLEEAGTVSCEASNNVGTERCEAPLKVNPSKDRKKAELEPFAPVWNVPLHDRKIPEGNPMSVECHVDGKPKPEIAWFKDGQPLQPSIRHEISNLPDGKCKLVIKEFGAEDEGVYSCKATNSVGEATTKATLKREPLPESAAQVSKDYAPRFTQPLMDIRLRTPGDPLILECRVDACPVADIKWFKDGFPVKPRGNVTANQDDHGLCTLRIDNASEEDAGAYRCVAANYMGSGNTAANAHVAAAKAEAKKTGIGAQFTQGLTDAWVAKGGQVRLTTTVIGDPKPEIKWYKDGIVLRQTDRIQVQQNEDGTCTLIINDASVSDEGLYRCHAENVFGTDQTTGTVHMEVVREAKKFDMPSGEAPKFVRPLEDKKADAGASVEIECQVTGDPSPVLKWSKDGMGLVEDHRVSITNLGNGSYRLRINEMKPAMEGTYRVVASNDVGSATTKATISISGPSPMAVKPVSGGSAPRFTLPPRGLRATVGKPFTLECKVEGEPMPELTWFKDGEKVFPNERISLEMKPDGSASLKINSAVPDDEGTYRVMANNPSGSANAKAAVTVKPAFNIAPLAANGDLPSDGGKAPKVDLGLQGVRVPEGQPIRLSARFSGSPTISLKWFKDGERVYPYGRVEIIKKEEGCEELVIPESRVSDAGCYRCLAENDFGSARSSAEAVVDARDKGSRVPTDWDSELAKGKAPGFSIPVTVRRVQEGKTLSFECLPYGQPFPSIKWMKDGMDLPMVGRFKSEAMEDGRQRLTITDAQLNDEGFYRCVASNEFGTASTKAELIVEPDPSKRRETMIVPEMLPEEPGRPRFRQGLQSLTVPEGSTAQFDVVIGGIPESSIKWFRDGKELVPDERHIFFKDEWGIARLVILNARKDDEADYSCEATNPHGMARTQCTLNVLKGRDWGLEPPRDGKGLPPGFLRQIKNKHAFSGMPVIFDCLVTGHPDPDVEWYKDGQRIIPSNNIQIQKAGGGSHALIIMKCSPDDAGEYSVVARNGVGNSATSRAVLDITKPHLDSMHPDAKFDLSALVISDFQTKRTPYASIPTPPDRGPFIAEVTGHYLTLSWIPTRRQPPRYPQVTYIIEMRELPDRDWVLLDYNIPEPVCKVRNLELGKSYQFRVRAENIYGISDPSPASPPSQLMAKPKPVLDANRRPIHVRDPYLLDAMSKTYGEQYASAPWFAPRPSDRIHCAPSETTEIVFYAYGFPDPQIKWTHRGHPVDTSPSSRFKINTYGGSEAVLTIRGFSKEDVGQYQCVATNKYGEAQQNIFVELAERPNFLQSLEDKAISWDGPIKLDVRVEGNPEPEVKWLKDWHPLVDSSRVQMIAEGPYLHSLIIHNPMASDTGIYSVVATNPGGRANTSCTVTFEDEPMEFRAPSEALLRRKLHLKPRKLREYYEVVEEVSK